MNLLEFMNFSQQIPKMQIKRRLRKQSKMWTDSEIYIEFFLNKIIWKKNPMMLAFVFGQCFLNVGKIKTCPLFNNRLLPDLLFHTGFSASTPRPPTSHPPPQRREIRFYCLSDNHANVKAVECSTNRSRWT